jgi:RimJ/RimL family protein N-acetyltransferase
MNTPRWPFFDLRIRTPHVELRYPDDDAVAALATLAAQGIHDPAAMPFLVPWTDVPSPQLERNTVQYHWRMRAELTAAAWNLPFAVYRDGNLVGQQTLAAHEFATLRTVDTGSWLGRAHQGQGTGKAMRAAVLHLAFTGLGAQRATSGAFLDNPASAAVSRALGYEDNGIDVVLRRGQAAPEQRFLLTRERWQQQPAAHSQAAAADHEDIVIEGLEPCLPLLGLSPPAPNPA